MKNNFLLSLAIIRKHIIRDVCVERSTKTAIGRKNCTFLQLYATLKNHECHSHIKIVLI